MELYKINPGELIGEFDNTTSQFFQLVSSMDEKQLNTIPFAGSWTAAQVAEHVTRSNESIHKSIKEKGRDPGRQADQGVENLKNIFLNFDSKLQSPKFILPTKIQYQKDALIANLEKSIEDLKGAANDEILIEMISHPVFGDVTKLELLHFVVYHTQRHLHQIKNILKSVQNQVSRQA